MIGLNDFELVLFDLDGVLINSMDAWFTAFNETLEKFGKNRVDRKEFRDRFWGSEMKEILSELGLDSKSFEYCRSKFEENIDLIKIFPNVRNVLDHLEEKIGLVTSTPTISTSKILQHFNLDNYFDIIIAGDDVEKPKPSPEPVIMACKELEVKPQNAVFIGDNKSDVKAGNKAGCKVIGVGVSGDEKISHVEELEKFLK